MSDRMLYVALCVSVLGLFILTYASVLMEPPLSKIGVLDSNSIGKQVHVQGVVLNVHRFSGGSLVISIADGSGEIDVYVSSSFSDMIPLPGKDDVVEVIGELGEYMGKLEVVPKNAESIRVFT